MGARLLSFYRGPGLAEKLATVGTAWQPPTPDGDGREDGIHFYKSADVHGQAFALASVLKGAAEGGRPPGDDLSTVIVHGWATRRRSAR